MLCSDCLAKSANQDCIEEDPKSSATSKTWTKEAKCFCKSGFIRNSEEQCVCMLFVLLLTIQQTNRTFC